MYKLDQLDNGLKVAAKPMPHMESFSLGVWIKSGGRYEDTKNNGISHLLEHMLFKGTKKRDTRKIKEEIEGRGGTFNGFTAEEFTCYLVKLLPKDIELGVDILSDMVLNPNLDEKEIEKEKNVIIEEINMYKDIPAQHVHEILTEMLWPDQPLGMPLAGTVESVKSMTRKDVLHYKDTYYNPRNILVVGTGKIGEKKLLDISEKYFGGTAGKASPAFKKAVSQQAAARVKLQAKDTEQTHMALGFHAVNRLDPDRYALSVANIILGANMSSRLFHIVRDELALCYEIASSTRRYEDAGAFVVSAGVDERKLVNALEVILSIIYSMKREAVPAEELNRAKEYYKGQLLFALEDTMSLMLWLGERIVMGRKDADPKKILERIDAVTPEDIMRVANRFFRQEAANLAVIGPVKEEKKLKEVLRLT
ncbi:MAG: insulinase family protein [Candidatus Omnitrophica bacterium]|nr:insulinase family protein [Candidatus Omnitrophota bacterium]